MEYLINTYNSLRKKFMPASKDDINWRHDEAVTYLRLIDNKVELLANEMKMTKTLAQVANGAVDGRENIDDIVAASSDGRLITLDYPIHPVARPYEKTRGGKKIITLLEAGRQRYAAALNEISAFSNNFNQIPLEETESKAAPFWNNGMFPGLDAAYLYTQIRTRKPKVYLEVGSGNSTKFARKAISDGGLCTKIISIDPFPRAEIDEICDMVIRKPFETLSEEDYLEHLSSGDIVFIDNSHRCFQSSDVTVFFTEMLPALPQGILYGLHDIYIPLDYPEQLISRFYNEQYMLLAYLLGGYGGDEIAFPGIFVSIDDGFKNSIDRIFDHPSLANVSRIAGGFWLLKG